ncbi:MAG: deoxynucleoside kinase [Chitinispirillaceae bacterium]
MDRKKSEGVSQPFSYLCVEGVIGAGKTSLCKLLVERLNARGLYEQADENPFLSSFYQDRHSYAFQTQVWFLLSRYRQLSEYSIQQDLFHPVTIGDYMFAKDKIFATINLDENELALYNTIAQALETKIPRPDCVVYLQVSTDVLLKRIEMRGRDYEVNMSTSYIEALNEAYNHYFFHYTQSPLLIINTNDIDFVNNKSDFEEIYKQIINARHGSTFYHPIGSKKNQKK